MDTVGAKPPREMRTVRRDGDLFTEDHEILNPDGTVTKRITTTDQKTGQTQVSVYRMDKSGIVRKLDESDLNVWAENDAKIQKMKDNAIEARAKLEEIKEQKERANSKSVAYETKDGAYLQKVIEDAAPDKYEMSYDHRNVHKPLPLTKKQQAMMREHKENILNYGTQKLIKQLNKKLNDDKFNKEYSLSDDQKDKVIEYGIRKLHRLLEKNLDDERLVYDLMSFSPDFGKVDLSGRGTSQIPGGQSVSFSLNPYEGLTPEDIAKPVSFSMRPEKQSDPLRETDNNDGKRVINNAYHALWKKLMKPGSNTEQGEGIKDNNSDLEDTNFETDNDNTDSDWQTDSAPEQKEKFDSKNLKNAVRELISNDEYYKKSPLPKDHKDSIVNYAVKKLRSIFKNSAEENEAKEIAKRKKKIDLSNYFDEDEIYDYGKRALKKVVRRSLKAFDLDQDMIRDELDDPDESAKRDAFYQYLGDIVEGRCKETDPIPNKVKKLSQKEAPEEENNWDYQSLISSIFGNNEKDKTQKLEEKPKEQQKKATDSDSFFSWLKDLKEDKTDSVKETPEPIESVPKVKPRFYQLDPTPNSKQEQNQTESESKGFDLKSLLKKIQDAAVKKFSESEPSEKVEKSSSQVHPPQNSNSATSQEKQLKQSDVDAALSRIRQNNNEDFKKPVNKPPYLKERIKGLDSIPRPTITTVSPPERNSDFNDQISFKLKPYSYENTTKQEDKTRPLENQRIETTKPSTHEQDFQPWWFESPESFVKKVIDKPLIQEAFIDSPMIKPSYSTGGNMFSKGGSMRNLLD